ncbi:hypothetical protein F7725_009283 [Dissostichus mawsoni]|uniref:Uncharacterized protein n=1 Tax=Dissostichus mawsoni TaxID=36200 RepID=A0A7J5Z6J9_DISMA|nr:hypothetical protein F7725_009283 [Dissostichus mawsoni]
MIRGSKDFQGREQEQRLDIISQVLSGERFVLHHGKTATNDMQLSAVLKCWSGPISHLPSAEIN